MERSNSFGTSWADQWDYSNPEPIPATKDIGHGGKKSNIEKTKAAAATGLKKVKEGTTMGFNWIKDKYHKKTQKNWINQLHDTILFVVLQLLGQFLYVIIIIIITSLWM